MSTLESITIIRPGGPTGEDDAQGNPIIGADSETISAGWKVAPRSSSESAEPFGQQVITGLALYRRSVADILASDRVRVRSVVWAVDGDIADWKTGLVVNVKRAS